MSDKVKRTIKAVLVLVLTLVGIWFGVDIVSHSNDSLALTPIQEIYHGA